MMKNMHRHAVAGGVLALLVACGGTVPQLATDAQTLSAALANLVGPIAAVATVPQATQTRIKTDLGLISAAAGSIATTPASATASAQFVAAVEDLAPAALSIAGASPAVAELVAATEALLPEFEAVAGITSTTAPVAAATMTQSAARAVVAKYAK